MADEADRYGCMLCPDDLWVVWDKEQEAPAMLAGCDLSSLDHDEASAFCFMLNSNTTSPG